MMDHKDYQKYLNSFKWKLVVEYMLGKYRNCAKCGETKDLVVHHITYENYPYEREEDLIVLCKKCHFNHHEPNYKYASEEKREFALISLQNTIKGTDDYFFNLNKISGVPNFLVNKKDIFHCEFCGKHIPASNEYYLNQIIFHSFNRFKQGGEIKGRNRNRRSFRLCLECRDELDKNFIKAINLTPKIAKLMLTDPPLEPIPKKVPFNVKIKRNKQCPKCNSLMYYTEGKYYLCINCKHKDFTVIKLKKEEKEEEENETLN